MNQHPQDPFEKLLRSKTAQSVAPSVDQKFWAAFEAEFKRPSLWKLFLNNRIVVAASAALVVGSSFATFHHFSTQNQPELMAELDLQPSVMLALDDDLMDSDIIKDLNAAGVDDEELNELFTI